MITVYNKADLKGAETLPQTGTDKIYMAAGKGIGVRELAGMIREKLYLKEKESSEKNVNIEF